MTIPPVLLAGPWDRSDEHKKRIHRSVRDLGRQLVDLCNAGIGDVHPTPGGPAVLGEAWIWLPKSKLKEDAKNRVGQGCLIMLPVIPANTDPRSREYRWRLLYRSEHRKNGMATAHGRNYYIDLMDLQDPLIEQRFIDVVIRSIIENPAISLITPSAFEVDCGQDRQA